MEKEEVDTHEEEVDTHGTKDVEKEDVDTHKNRFVRSRKTHEFSPALSLLSSWFRFALNSKAYQMEWGKGYTKYNRGKELDLNRVNQ